MDGVSEKPGGEEKKENKILLSLVLDNVSGNHEEFRADLRLPDPPGCKLEPSTSSAS